MILLSEGKMILKILKDSFISWFENIGFSIVSSILASVNPFFVLLAFIIFNAFYGNRAVLFQKFEAQLLTVALITAVQAVFPTTVAAVSVQKKVVQGEVNYMSEYFPAYLKSLLETLLPSIIMSVFYFIITYLLVWSGILYSHMLTGNFKIVMVSFITCLYVFFLLTQWIAVPLIIERKKITLSEAIKLTTGTTSLEIFTIIVISFIDLVILIGLTLLAGISAVLYFSISSYFRVILYQEIIEKYKKIA
jgi:hypothetical protein